ncbi:hypothetical protein LCGC14_2110330 [marine sediment metagenome]|uniref:Uncharacterized protein n=1 Tax=marine sediment metagenome TaxID=412755 RepID=A0A0F9EUG2_9ZZZZ
MRQRDRLMPLSKQKATKMLDEGLTWDDLRGLLNRTEREGDSVVNGQISLYRAHVIYEAAIVGRLGPIKTWTNRRGRTYRPAEFLIARNILRDFGPL